MCKVRRGTRLKWPYGSGHLQPEINASNVVVPLVRTCCHTPTIRAFIIRCIVDAIPRHFCSVAIHFRNNADVLAMCGLRFSAIM